LIVVIEKLLFLMNLYGVFPIISDFSDCDCACEDLTLATTALTASESSAAVVNIVLLLSLTRPLNFIP
jgi:hypothetical protein